MGRRFLRDAYYPVVFALLLFSSWPQHATATANPGANAGMAVTDLQVVVADSESQALRLCHQLDGGGYVSVGVDWTMQQQPEKRFTQLCKKRQSLEEVACFKGHVVQEIRILAADACPAGPSSPPSTVWTQLYKPRDGVVVCLAKTPALQAQQSQNYLVDVDVSSSRFYTDAVAGWTTLRDASVHEWRNAADERSYSGVFLSVRRPLRAITLVSIVTTNASDPSSLDNACGDAGGTSSGSFPASDGRVATLCVYRATSPRMLVDARVVRPDEAAACGGGSQSTLVAFTKELALCLSWQIDGDDTTTNPFISDLLLDSGSSESGYEDAITTSGFVRLAVLGDTALIMRRYDPKQGHPSGSTTKPPLRAKYNAKANKLSFKILQLADLHFSGDAELACRNAPSGGCSEAMMTQFVSDLLDLEKPDFVVFTGDNVQTSDATFHQLALSAATEEVEKRSIPYAMVFGNHDDENGFSRAKLMEQLMAKKHSYTQRGPVDVDGVGNYQLHVQAPVDGPWGANNSAVFRMYFLDSHTYSDSTKYPMADSNYDWIKPSQVQFYQQLTASNTNKVEAALMFFHIPLPEYAAAPPSGGGANESVQGDRNEGVMGASVNSHLFSALVDANEVKATFVGHDHLNDYCYNREGIQLCYGGGAGFGKAYGSSDIQRRARVIEWSMDPQTNKQQIQTWMRLHEKLDEQHSLQVLYNGCSTLSASSTTQQHQGATSDSNTAIYMSLSAGLVLMATGFVLSRKTMRDRLKVIHSPSTSGGQQSPQPINQEPLV